MQLQKFVGESMPVVLSNLKDALGSDAIILANRRVGDHIEIIATGTLDETSIDNAELFNSNNNVNSTALTTNDSIISGIDSDVTAEKNNQSNKAVELFDDEPPKEVVKAVFLDVEKTSKSSIQPPDDMHCVPKNSDSIAQRHELDANAEVDAIAESDSDSSADADADASASASASAVVGSSAELVNDAVAELIADRVNSEVEIKLEQFHTTMNRRLSQLEVNLWGEKDPVKSKHLQTLLEIGLGAELAVALVNRVGACATFDEALRLSLSDLANTLPVASDCTLTHDGVTFVTGPSGSGKTTVLLKLAAHKMSMSGSDSVVMICADAKRIGVFESLAAHGNALGVSVVCASTQRELKELLSFYANKELVLVDQPLQKECKEFDFIENSADINDRSVRHLLVLPATIQSSVAEGVVSEFSKHASARCVITNLDRPCRVGELFTSIIRNNLRVAYWSECSDIHQPLNKASAQTLVAAAMAMSKRLLPTEDERYLMDLIHPRFSASLVPMLRASL